MGSAAKEEYKNVGSHSEDLADGRIIAVGQVLKVDTSEPHNQRLIKDGVLIPIPKKETTKKKAGDDS